MPVDFSNQHAAVTMSNPSGYGEKVYAAHDGVADEVMPGGVKCESAKLFPDERGEVVDIGVTAPWTSLRRVIHGESPAAPASDP